MPHQKALIKSGVIFQLKLGLDAARDLLLSPVSVVALIVDLVTKKNPEESYFYKLMRWGRFSDHWINLFSDTPPGQVDSNNIDNLLEQVELQVFQKHLTESKRKKITQYLEILNSKSSTTSPIDDDKKTIQ